MVGCGGPGAGLVPPAHAGTLPPSPPSLPSVASTLRYQPECDANPLSFIDVKARSGGVETASVRGCFFSPAARGGLFGTLAVAPGAAARLRVGARYSSPAAAAGAILDMAGQRTEAVWAVARAGAVTVGVQVAAPGGGWSPPGIPAALRGDWAGAASDVAAASTACVSYSPSSIFGAGTFTAALELRQGRELAVSVLQHLAVQRRVRNPLEDGNVLGITNYLDLGLQVVSPVGAPLAPALPSDAPAAWRVAAAWQANKNWKAKAAAGPQGASVAVVVKGWGNPSVLVGAHAAWAYGGRLDAPRLGLYVQAENFGGLTYERLRGAPALTGSAVLQRHVALPEDVANARGEGVFVEEADFDNPAVVGQPPNETATYL